MSNDQTDILRVEIRNGFYEFNFSGVRRGSNQPSLKSGGAPSFISFLQRIMDYGSECQMHSAERSSQVYLGAGSDRGEWRYVDMVPWKTDIRTPMTLEDKTLLESIVVWHNVACGMHEAIKKI